MIIVCLFVCLFVGIDPEKLYFASCWKESKPPESCHTRAEAQHHDVHTEDNSTNKELVNPWYRYSWNAQVFWFLVCYAATQLANQLQQTRIQVMRSNNVARKRLTESNGTPTMDLGHMDAVLKVYYFYVLFYDCCFEVDIRIRRYTNRR